MEYVTLNNGVVMPKIGVGTFTLSGKKLSEVVRAADKIGYKHFDTAWLYQNESSLKWALRWAGIKRKDIFITSKLEWKQLMTEPSVTKCFEGTLKRLGTDYLDLYLVHWPKPELYLDMWKGLIDLYRDGRIRAIGVSSFLPEHIDRIVELTGVVPAINQIELHPLNNRRDVVEYCRAYNIQIEAHSPFARGSAVKELMDNPVLLDIAKKYNKSVAQVILRWDVQQGFVVIPRTDKAEKLSQNYNVFDFELTSDEMGVIDSLNQNRFFGGDPRRTLPFI